MALTAIEMQAFEQIIKACQKYISGSSRINWEQRRWELISAMAAAREGASYGHGPSQSIERIIKEADEIIAKYKSSTTP